MGNKSSEFGRGLFGYRRSSVNQAIAERDIKLHRAQQRARDAEARTAELQEGMAALEQRMQVIDAQLAGRDAEMAERDEQIAALRGHLDRLVNGQIDAPAQPESAVPMSERVSQEVARVLRTAEESAASIVEQARVIAAQISADSERQWREVQTTLARFAGWRDRVEPQMTDLHARMEELRGRISDIPDRVRAAFTPLAESSAAAEAGLQSLADDIAPPLLLAPTRPPVADDAVSGVQDEADTSGSTDGPDARNSAR